MNRCTSSFLTSSRCLRRHHHHQQHQYQQLLFLSTAIGSNSSFIINNNNNNNSNNTSFYNSTTSSRNSNNTCRFMGTGTRGSRGHGWYVNYRKGGAKGGRHLRGEYADRIETIEECIQWNQSILELGSQQVYIDIVMQPISSDTTTTATTTTTTTHNNTALINEHSNQRFRHHPNELSQLYGERFRLIMNIASTVMPETTQNFINLCNDGYVGTKLYRIEKTIGLLFGDIVTNTGKSGKANGYDSNILQLDIYNDPLVMFHIPGTVSMMVPKVNTIDSRFILCTSISHHLDGIHRPFGQLTNDSIQIISNWHTTLLTRNGIPTSYDLIITNCGLVQEEEDQQQQQQQEEINSMDHGNNNNNNNDNNKTDESSNIQSSITKVA